MAKSNAHAPDDTLAFYEEVVASIPGVTRKGATVPYTSLNGHMFSYLSKTGVMALRLSPEVRDAFLKKYKATLCTQYGVVQKEYVEVPGALLKKTAELRTFVEMSLNYVRGMKPKAAPRKKKSR